MLESVRRSSTSHAAGDPVYAGVYVSQPGDTVEGVAIMFGITGGAELSEFQRLNPGLRGALAPGTRVYVPGELAPTAAPAHAAPERTPVETSWTRRYGRSIAQQNRFNAPVEAAATRWPDLPPAILKSVLAQESGFRPEATNHYGYAGIAQLGLREARSVGLATGSSRMRSKDAPARFDRARDERFNPSRAIPGAAALLRAKARTLDSGAVVRGARLAGFRELGRPEGDDYWRFATAAYNGGEGTVLMALYYAYGNKPPERVRWDDLVNGPGGDVTRSPLWRACARFFARPGAKYAEISEYARDVVLRARQ
jgi:hypothetical protein